MHGVSNLTAPLGQVARKPEVVTGQRLAKSSVGYPLWVRAEDAARWLSGEVVVQPTAKMACQIFRVSYPVLKQAQALIGQNKPRGDHVDGTGAATLSDDEVVELIAWVGIDRTWRALEKLTQPELPLQAAE
jgi:hypothetical protein